MIDEELSTLLKQALRQYIKPPLDLDPNVLAYRFYRGELTPIHPKFHISLDDLLGIERQKNKLIHNTEQFIYHLPCNHVLMTGARGVGKSSLVHALLHAYYDKGLRMIEINKNEFSFLSDINSAITNLNNPNLRYIIYCDDLSFNSQDEHYRTLKTLLDGSLSIHDNLLVYATSNRRHLLPQFMKDNLAIYNQQTDEINPHEQIDETVSLSDRFGLWLSFYPLSQDDYLAIVTHYLAKAQLEFNETIRAQSLQFASERGVRSGRIALQFSKDWIGKTALDQQR